MTFQSHSCLTWNLSTQRLARMLPQLMLTKDKSLKTFSVMVKKKNPCTYKSLNCCNSSTICAVIHKVFDGQMILLIVRDCDRLPEREFQRCCVCVKGFRTRSETIAALIVHARTAANFLSHLLRNFNPPLKCWSQCWWRVSDSCLGEFFFFPPKKISTAKSLWSERNVLIVGPLCGFVRCVRVLLRDGGCIF